jgi:hypothetical protein
MSKIIKIYCEGKKGSHDYDILEKVILGLPSVQIEPIGSIRGAGAIIQYKEKEIVKSDFKILFRDRDFDCQIPDQPILEQDENRPYCYFSYRNTIENYLFDTHLFFSFIQNKKLGNRYSITNEEDVKNLFISSAKNIRYYQAVRHALGKLRTNKADFGTKLTSKSGVLPQKLDEDFCVNEAIKAIEQSKSYTENWNRDGFYDVYTQFKNLFDDSFLADLKFLVYFQGKDFATALMQNIAEFPISEYFKYAKLNFDYMKFEDIVALRKLIEQNQ